MKEKLSEEYTFVQREGKIIKIKIVFPKAGEYVLQVFAKKNGEMESYEWALDYKIIAEKGQTGKIGFPDTYADYFERNIYLFEPINKYLKSGSNQSFKIEVPNAEKVAVIINNNSYYLARTLDIFYGDVLISSGEIGLFAKFPGNKNYSSLLGYVAY